MASRRITLRLRPELERRLRRWSALSRKDTSTILREALEEYLDKEEPRLVAYDMASLLGLIGCVKSAPKDLSTNPRHFDGFGRR